VDSTRRGFLGSASLTGLAGVVAPRTGLGSSVAFHGDHQAGIATPAQEHVQFAALDMVSRSRADLRDLMRSWSKAGAAMAVGNAIGPVETGTKPAGDTGEALGLHPANLTMTFGFGPSLFANGNRFGLAKQRPAPLIDLPSFGGEALRPAISDRRGRTPVLPQLSPGHADPPGRDFAGSRDRGHAVAAGGPARAPGGAHRAAG